MKRLTTKLHHLILIVFTFLYARVGYAAGENIMEKLGQATSDTLLTGDWQTKVAAGAIVIVGLMFLFGKLVWTWALAIIAGIIIIANAEGISDYFFSLAG